MKIGTAVLLLPLFTDHLIPGYASVLSWYRQRIEEKGVVPNVFTLAIGPACWVVHAALVALAAWYLWRTVAAQRQAAAGPRSPARYLPKLRQPLTPGVSGCRNFGIGGWGRAPVRSSDAAR